MDYILVQPSRTADWCVLDEFVWCLLRSSSEFENLPKPSFFLTGPSKSGPPPLSPYPLPCTSLLITVFKKLQKFALCEMGDRLRSPPAGLDCDLDCNTTMVCTKKGRKARRREGDKCFFSSFFRGGGTFPTRSGDWPARRAS